jgi:hypothetical protein
MNEQFTVENACGCFWVVDNDPPPGASRYVRNTTSDEEAKSLAEALNDWLDRRHVKEPTIAPPA